MAPSSHRRPVTASFAPHDADVVTATDGQRAHRAHAEHSARFERQVHRVTDGVWCVVGNGISNQTFVEGPEGLVVIDTGECVEDMRWALDQMAQETATPVAAVIYTHSHYVGGTAAIEGAGTTIPVWGHAGIVRNRQMVGMELSAASTLGAIHQFGLLLPREGPDGLVNVGLGNEFSRRDHATHTAGFVAPDHTLAEPVATTIAGLRVELTPAPSDVDDSITIWFPDLGLCVNNILWPALFNVFAIRGEEYRDPRVLLAGLDHLIGLDAAHLAGAHGLPISGADRIRSEATRARDALQYLWDQTVRGINRGLSAGELTSFVQLPERFQASPLTQQLYGIVEHHVRQIHAGLRGWFDNDETRVLPLPPAERAERLVEAMGGAEAVRSAAEQARDADDLRWALELAGLLVQRHGDEAAPEPERAVLGSVLRAIGQRTTSANLRNWCLTRALEHEGAIDLDAFRVHRFGRQAVLAGVPRASVEALRVLVDPSAADGVEDELRWRFPDGSTVGLRIRNQVAVPTDGRAAELELALALDHWADVLSGRATLADLVADGTAALTGDVERIAAVVACFDLATLRL